MLSPQRPSHVLGSLLPWWLACALALSSLPARAQDVRAQEASADAVARLERELREARADRASTTRLWPLLTLGIGIGALLAGTIVGADEALSCDHTCHAPPWVSVAVVGGAAVATGGLIWLQWTNASIRVEDTRVRRLEDELDIVHKRQLPSLEPAATPPHAAFNVRFSF
ncbi:MAG TPA: hypothetical protein VHM19_13555 [Polyangiales bacterium]|nr:hypothetical protein [Polyangiales bacterium]